MMNNRFWESASSAIQTFSSTLDQLDRTVGDDDSGDEAANDSDEMQACRTLLEKSQMDIVQISQQSRVLLAEKEASINMWRQKYLESTGNIEPADMSSLIDMEALLTERNALLANLSALEERLKEEHAKQSGPAIKAQMYDDLLLKHSQLSEEHEKLVADEAHKSREESETIEHLVSEYTNLGAEFERRQAADAARIEEVERENEVLTMKLLAMEHSITDFADRATASTTAASGSDATTSTSELKELRAKVVNLQFDVKEKEDEISRLTGLLAAGGTGDSASNLIPEESLVELENIRAELSKLSVEKEEADAIGKTVFEESQTLRKEVESLKAAVAEAESAASTAAAGNDKSEADLSQLRDEISVLVTDLDDKVAQCSGYEGEIETLKAEIETLKSSYEASQSSLTEAIDEKKELQGQALKHDGDIAAAASKVAEAAAATATLERRIAELEESHRADVMAASSGSEAHVLERIEREVTAERAKGQIEMENALNNLRVELEDSYALMQQQKHDEMTESSSRNLKDLKSSCDSERESALQKLSEERASQHEAALAELRQQLESKASSDSTAKLTEQRTELELTLEKVVAEERQKASCELAAAVQKQKDEDAVTLQQTVDSVREELTKSMAGDSEEKFAAMEADFECSLAAAVAAEKKMAQNELVAAVKKQMDDDAAALAKAVDESKEMLKAQMEAAHEDRVKILQTEFDSSLSIALTQAEEKAKKDIASAVQQQAETDSEALKKSLDELRQDLANKHAEELSKLREESNAALAVALESEKSRSEAALEEVIKIQKEESEKSKDIALSELRASMKTELEAALSRANDELRSAVDAEKTSGRIALEASVEVWTARVAEKEDALAGATAELEAMNTKFDEKLEVEIAAVTRQKDIEMAHAISEIRTETDALVAKAKAEREEFLQLYTKEYKQRKLIHNKLLEIQGNIRVLCRVRPVLEVERKMAADVDVTEIPNEDTIIIHRDIATKNRYEFDQVFAPDSTQERVFEAVQPLVISVLDGYNVCIFAYGQTGSGKTFTMEGAPDNLGVSPRAINELFRVIDSAAEDWVYTVTFSTLEIYNETIRDLLDATADKEKLDVRQTPQGNSVPGLTEVQVTSAAQVLSLMSQGQSNRAVGSHDMNEHSSRSHSILTLVCEGKSLRDGNTTYGKMHLIDLAGSERIAKTDASGDRLKEAQNINRSLSALGDVINALGNKKNSHIPYRNSKLTFLLQDSLGGNSKVLMFVNTSPAVYNLGETVCSLNFAARCRNVELGSAKKQSESSDSMGPPQAKTLVKRTPSNAGSDSASRRSTFGTPSSRK